MVAFSSSDFYLATVVTTCSPSESGQVLPHHPCRFFSRRLDHASWPQSTCDNFWSHRRRSDLSSRHSARCSSGSITESKLVSQDRCHRFFRQGRSALWGMLGTLCAWLRTRRPSPWPTRLLHARIFPNGCLVTPGILGPDGSSAPSCRRVKSCLALPGKVSAIYFSFHVLQATSLFYGFTALSAATPSGNLSSSTWNTISPPSVGIPIEQLPTRLQMSSQERWPHPHTL